MRLIHLSDLHLGKRVNEFSMLEDQKYILDEILRLIDRSAADAVLLAGDIYDKSVPPAEAVQLFDDFLCRLAERGLEVFVISGNHDSPERIAFGARLMAGSGVHLSPVYRAAVKPITLADRYGPVHFYLLPFFKPVQLRRLYPDEEIATYTDAVRRAVEEMHVDREARNILVTHHFVTGALRSDSEERSVGGMDNVDAEVFANFDYVALGHIHGPQNIGAARIRYCGSPLKYSFSEARQQKSVTLVTLEEKGTLRVETLPLTPRRELRELRGRYIELTARANYIGTNTDDYLHITLTDEEDIPDAIGRLRAVYPNLMLLDYDNRRTRAGGELGSWDAERPRSPMELFTEFYEKQNGGPMRREQSEYLAACIERIWEGEP